MFPRLSRPVIPGIFCLIWEDRAFKLNEDVEDDKDVKDELALALDLAWALLLLIWFDLK